jgi:hypothetical protein
VFWIGGPLEFQAIAIGVGDIDSGPIPVRTQERKGGGLGRDRPGLTESKDSHLVVGLDSHCIVVKVSVVKVSVVKVSVVKVSVIQIVIGCASLASGLPDGSVNVDDVQHRCADPKLNHAEVCPAIPLDGASQFKVEIA